MSDTEIPMVALTRFKIMPEGKHAGMLPPDGVGAVDEAHVAKWFADARSQGHTFTDIGNDEAQMTDRDGGGRKVWVIDVHTGKHVPLTKWLT